MWKLNFCTILAIFVANSCAQMIPSSQKLVLENDNVASFSDASNEFWIRVARAHVTMILQFISMDTPTDLKAHPLSGIVRFTGDPQQPTESLISKFQQCCSEAEKRLLLVEQSNSQNPAKHELSHYTNLIWKSCSSLVPEHYAAFTKSEYPYDPNTDIFIQYPVPVFHCNQYRGKGDQIKTFFRMEYTESLPHSIANFLSDMIPRSFIVEMRKGVAGKWELLRDDPEGNWIFSVNTEIGEAFQIRVTAVSPTYVYKPASTPFITIHDPTLSTRNTSMDIQVVNISVNKKTSGNQAFALLHWKSSVPVDEPFQASCDFDVFYMDDDEVKKVKRRNGEEAFWVKLPSLKYDNSYNVRVIEKFGGDGGKEAEVISSSLHIHVPSCLQLHNFSFESCPPPQPTNIRMVNVTSDSFMINWQAPKYSDEHSNKILHYNVTVERIYSSMMLAYQSYSSGYSTVKIMCKIVPGNTTSVLVQNITPIIGQYSVHITAVGQAGSSQSAWSILSYEGTPEEHINSKTWTVTADRQIFIFVLFGLLGSFLSLLMLHMGVIYILKKLPLPLQNQSKEVGEKVYPQYEKHLFAKDSKA